MQFKDSAAKRHRQSLKRRLRNKVAKSKVKTTFKKIEEAIRVKNLDEAKKNYIEYVALVDRAVSNKTYHRNTAARKKARLSKRIKNAAIA